MIDSNLYDLMGEVSKHVDLRGVHYVQPDGVGTWGKGWLVERSGRGKQYTVYISPICISVFKNIRQKHE